MKSHSFILLAGLLAGSVLLIPASLPAAPAGVSVQREVDAALKLARVADVAPIRRLLAQRSLAPSTRHLLTARIRASKLDDGAAISALRRYFANGDTDAARLREAHEIGALTAFAAGRYADAARHGAQVVARPAGLIGDQIDGIRRLTEIAKMLASSPPQRLERRKEGSTSIFRDKVGLIRARIASGQASEEAIIDTGANLSVASASAARRMGLRMLDGASSVGNSVGTEAKVRVAIADRIEIAGAALHNVVFLVMDDRTLEFPVPGGYRIDTIIGFPVLRALGRLNFGPDNLKVGGVPAAGAKASQIRMVGNMPYIATTLANAEFPLVFDSGANESVLHPRFALARPDLKAVDSGKKQSSAGAGGAKEVRIAYYPRLSQLSAARPSSSRKCL